MLGIINSIKNLALEMRTTTSVNDDNHERLQDISDMCDELSNRIIDDGK
jgi:hypothetical protein